MNEEMKKAWAEITEMLGEPTREELDVFLRAWQRATEAHKQALAEQPVQQEPVKFKCTVIDDAHPNGIPLSQWGQQRAVTAVQKDEVFTASIEFIGTLTGMNPPPIEVAPPEILKPFKDFTEKVCSIFAAPQPAQQEPRIDIYRSFEQWKRGNVLEHGVPRTEHYSEAQLDLVEMGWNYGYDAGRAVEQALDKKAENARELGLDYEPAQQEYERGFIDGMQEQMKRSVDRAVNAMAQRTWVELTLEDMETTHWSPDFRAGAKWAAAKLKEKNT